MTAITASMVGALRAKTDAPMMECKKALTEAAGDMDKAEEILRVKLGNKAGKAAARITAEGVVSAYIDGLDHGQPRKAEEIFYCLHDGSRMDQAPNIKRTWKYWPGGYTRTVKLNRKPKRSE